MAGELEPVVQAMMRAFEKQDIDAALANSTEDMVGVDEVSRRWMRGRSEIAGYFKELVGMVTDVRSELKDVDEKIDGDIGVLTCWLEQDYVLQGEKVHVSAPTTCVLRREGSAWKMALFHSIPLADQG